MAIMEQGLDKFGRLIDQNIAQARCLAELVRAHPPLELLSEPELNIVCFRYAPQHLGEADIAKLNIEIMISLQESGLASMSDTTIDGKHCLRAAICNHRTEFADLAMVVTEVVRLGDAAMQRDIGPAFGT